MGLLWVPLWLQYSDVSSWQTLRNGGLGSVFFGEVGSRYEGYSEISLEV